MVTSAELARQAQDVLILPGVWGSDVPTSTMFPFLRRLIEHRKALPQAQGRQRRKLRPDGYTLDDIWNGDGRNPNALLTVFRHFDTAVVTQGAVGRSTENAIRSRLLTTRASSLQSRPYDCWA